MTTLKSVESSRTLTVRKHNGAVADLTFRNSPRDPDLRVIFVEGPALRDALLEAFPLPEAEPTPSGAEERLADWEKELLTGVKPKQVPGEVYSDGFHKGFVILPEGRYYDLELHRSYTYSDFATDSLYKRVFDPRDAVALPSPLGIRVGDTVRRTEKVDGETRVVEFEVNHIGSETGFISTKYGRSYSPKGFEVTSREVPDRLPAGTIVRLTGDVGDLRLITAGCGVHLTGYVNPRPEFRDGSDYGRLVKDGSAEVIYLPES